MEQLKLICPKCSKLLVHVKEDIWTCKTKGCECYYGTFKFMGVHVEEK